MNEPKEKVYCINCKHALVTCHKLFIHCYYKEYFSSPTRPDDYRYPFAGKENTQNEHNDCEYYEKKWWKKRFTDQGWK